MTSGLDKAMEGFDLVDHTKIERVDSAGISDWLIQHPRGRIRVVNGRLDPIETIEACLYTPGELNLEEMLQRVRAQAAHTVAYYLPKD